MIILLFLLLQNIQSEKIIIEKNCKSNCLIYELEKCYKNVDENYKYLIHNERIIKRTWNHVLWLQVLFLCIII